jgi:siroheme synthase (precorrin-2 oxidase/ferrochelatase)
MRIFILGTGEVGALLAHLLVRQGHTVWCGDRDLERARRFLGKRSPIRLVEANARNLWSVVRAGRGCHLVINASSAVFNEAVMRAALRLRAHYLDLAVHLARHPFKPEHFYFAGRFEQKGRVAVIAAGAAPGLTNLLAARSAEMLDQVESIHLRIYESTASADAVSTWSAEGAFDQAVSPPSVYRHGRFRMARRFNERELFRFPPPVGVVPVYLAAQDEVATVPRAIRLREMDAKIGGNEIERLRRWHRQGKLRRSRGLVVKRFPQTPTPRQVARLIRSGTLQNAWFLAAVIVRGMKKEQPLEIRWDASFPSLYQIRRQGLLATPIGYATAHMTALFIKHFPRGLAGAYAPEALPREIRQAILEDARARGIALTMKIKRLKRSAEEEEI